METDVIRMIENLDNAKKCDKYKFKIEIHNNKESYDELPIKKTITNIIK